MQISLFLKLICELRDENKIVKLNRANTREDQFEMIYEEHFDRLFFFAKTIVKSEPIAEDIIADVFLNLWKSKTRFSEIRELDAYLFIAVKNEAVRKIHEEPLKADRNSLEITAQTIDRINPEEILLEKELADALEEVVSTLPDQCQLIFRMVKNRQMKYQEIADELGISISTVRTQLTKAFSIVRKFLYERYHGSTDTSSNQSNVLPVIGLFLLSLKIDQPEEISIF